MKVGVFSVFFVGPVHCLWDSQVQKNANIKLKLGSMVLITHLKIILLQYFQFLVFSNNRYLVFYIYGLETTLSNL